MAEHYKTVSGSTLAQMLQADGWTLDWTRNRYIQLSKDGNCPIGIDTACIIPKKRVSALCRSAGISTTQFNQLLRGVGE